MLSDYDYDYLRRRRLTDGATATSRGRVRSIATRTATAGTGTAGGGRSDRCRKRLAGGLINRRAARRRPAHDTALDAVANGARPRSRGLSQRHCVRTRREAELPGCIVRGTPYRLGHVGLRRHHGGLRKCSENGLSERRVCLGNQLVDAQLRILRRADGSGVPGSTSLTRTLKACSSWASDYREPFDGRFAGGVDRYQRHRRQRHGGGHVHHHA